MATDRVGIEIELMGYDDAMRQMQNLDREIKGLKGLKNRIKIKAEIDKLKLNKDALKAHKVMIEADTRKLDKDLTRANNELRRMKKNLDVLKSDKSPFSGSINAKAIESAEAAIRRLEDRIRELNSMKVELGGRMKDVQAEINQTTSYLQRLMQAYKNAASASAMFKRNTTAVAHLGSAMQSAGNAAQRFLAPWRLLTGGALLGAGYSAINKMSEGLSSGFERYDIMKKYNRMMKGFEKGNYTAKKSIDELDKSVQGLPTGLDEMVSLAQRFTMTTGDMKKGTELAIATNNAFLASMSTDTQRYQGMMQLQDVLGGKKMGAKEWQSLANSMMPAIRMMGESLGKTGEELDQYVADVQQGKISNEEFIETLKNAGQEGGKIYKMAQKSKDTWQAFSSRIGTAFSRMTYGVLTSLDKIVKKASGGKYGSLNSMLDDMIIPGIDNMTKSAKKWIKAHPKEITNFFKDLKSVDWAGLARGFVNGLGQIANFIQRAAKWINGKSLEGLGNFFSHLLWLAPAFTIVGGMLKGFRHVFGGGLTGLALLIDTVAGLKVGKAEKNASKLGKLASKLGKIGKLFGGAGLAGEAVAGAAGGVGAKAGAGAVAKGFLPALTIIGGIGAVVTEITGIAAINTWIIDKGIQNLISITDGVKQVIKNVNSIKDTNVDKGALKSAVSAITDIYGLLYGDQENQPKTRGANKAGTSLLGGEKGFGDISPFKTGKSASAIENMKMMFKQIQGVLKQIPVLNELIGQTIGTQQGRGATPFSQLKNALTGENGLFTMFGQIMESFDGSLGKNVNAGDFAAKMEQLSTAVSSIKSAVSKLSALGTGDLAGTDTGAFTAITNIKTMISKIGEALNTDALNGIREQVKAFSDEITNMFDTLNSDFAKVEVEVHINGKVTGYKELIAQIKSANSAIRSAVRSITNSYTRHVYIHIQRHVNVTGDTVPSDGEVIGRHTGGLATHLGKPIYRSGGGSVFKPKGKDIIPAMLSEGEYVQSKKAVDFFGVRFMQKLNHLDVKGAMRELSARVGANSVMARGMTVYNNITNNNQTVNQNVRTNNPNFAFRRSRYIAAL